MRKQHFLRLRILHDNSEVMIAKPLRSSASWIRITSGFPSLTVSLSCCPNTIGFLSKSCPTMFVQVFETHQVFETVDYLTFHLPLGLEIFTESVFMYEICSLKIIERVSKICVLGT